MAVEHLWRYLGLHDKYYNVELIPRFYILKYDQFSSKIVIKIPL